MAKNNSMTRNTTKLSKSRQLQIEYWSNRAERNFLAGEKDALDIAKGLSKNYKDAMKQIEEKINGFYGKYASQNGISFEDAQKLLNKSELKSFKEYLDECIEYKKNNDIPSRQYELLKLKTKVTRWDELRTQLQYELDKLTVSNQEDVKKMLYSNYEEGYYKSVFDAEQFKGFISSFNGLDKQSIERAIKTKWLGDNYSSRIWKNQNSLMNILSQDLPRGLTLGTNPRELAKQVSKRLNTNYNNTVRLVRTEYANVLNNSTMAGYKASGIDRYQILAALDERTCDDCGIFNEEIFDIANAKEGINMPPFHPNCRCTTIPYFEEDEIDKMSEEELDNIGFITYNEWKDGLVTLKNGKVIYKVNSKTS